MNCSVIITSFNGRHLLEKHLPTVIKNSPEAKEIYVFDDAGTDDTPEWIVKKYPKIHFHRNRKNLGFTKNTNQAISSLRTDFVVLLNNDVSPSPNYINKSLKYFSDPNVLSVTFAEKEHSWPKVSWSNGKLQFTEGDDRSHARNCAWPSGGSCIVKRSIWNKLNGFNEIYSPGYWEDIDLGWRAWKQGYKTIWDPNITVDHQHESTFKKLNPNYINLIKQRNELFFLWLNITDSDFFSSHISFLLTHTLSHPGYSKVILTTLKFYSQIRLHRSLERNNSSFTDKEVIDLINRPLKV